MPDADLGVAYVRAIEDEAAATIGDWLSEPEVLGERAVVLAPAAPREFTDDHPFLFLLMLAGVVWAILTFVE